MKKPSKSSPPRESNWINIEDFEYICFNTARELMSFSEPIPDYTTRENSLLESALASPRQTFDGKLLYPTLEEQAAVLFYSLIKNHPFKNGNKRIAVMSLLIFLTLNNKWIEMNPVKLYRLAYVVSGSSPSIRDEVLGETIEILKKYQVPFPKK
ncbi:MAG: type II toxin-antitoxin system death-on-curing family toxin [Candidatus Levybacteria bacterium]|nr:type II toxin-antitoxin system death-on-curing family toxin [Candidatus Levybacteria bacterium]